MKFAEFQTRDTGGRNSIFIFGCDKLGTQNYSFEASKANVKATHGSEFISYIGYTAGRDASTSTAANATGSGQERVDSKRFLEKPSEH